MDGSSTEACDRCGPAVRAAYRANREGELYLCGHCTNRLSPALSAQGWTIRFISECGGRSSASCRSPAGAGPGGQDAAQMAAEADAELEAQMRGGTVRRLLHASYMYIARACAFLGDLDPQAIAHA